MCGPYPSGTGRHRGERRGIVALPTSEKCRGKLAMLAEVGRNARGADKPVWG